MSKKPAVASAESSGVEQSEKAARKREKTNPTIASSSSLRSTSDITSSSSSSNSAQPSDHEGSSLGGGLPGDAAPSRRPPPPTKEPEPGASPKPASRKGKATILSPALGSSGSSAAGASSTTYAADGGNSASERKEKSSLHKSLTAAEMNGSGGLSETKAKARKSSSPRGSAAAAGNGTREQGDGYSEITHHHHQHQHHRHQQQQQQQYTGDPVRPRGELTLMSLPHPTLLHILSFLSCKDLCLVSLVSRRFNVLATENELWKLTIAREWSHKRMLKGYGKKHVLHQKNTKSKKISQQLMVIDYKQELKNHILFKRSVGKQAKTNRKKASVWNFAKRDCYLLLLGLDKSGKTTILYDAKAGRHELIYSIPTIGYNAEELEILDMPFAIWDIGGLAQIRHTWTHYMPNAQGLIWVLDSADTERMQEARAELHRVLRDEALRTRKLLVLANKQDVPGAWDARTIAKYLQLDSPEFMSEWEWYVQPCSVMTSSGREALCAGLEWLVHDSSAAGGAQESVWQKLKTSFV